jgi:class 3 adenylate cyclase/tetratricopeptide (TPR) repeat protein
MMHCDVTGFTAMSERLAQRGKEGAEVMVEVLNKFFDRMLGIADGWGGEQMKFGGDAMLLIFPGSQHARMAAACGLEMQSAMSEFRSFSAGGEKHTLRMRIGIHSGSFLIASVGDPENLLHLLVTGRDVNRAAEVEPAAAPGRVALSTQAAIELGDSASVTPIGNGLFNLRQVQSEPPGPSARQEPPWARVLDRYVHPAIRERAARADLAVSEHRRATVMFINLRGLSDLLEQEGQAAAVEQANSYFNLLLDSLVRHGGFLLGSDAAEDGDKLIALFGAPISRASPEAAALSCSLELNSALNASGLKLRHRIGVNSGFVFAGEIGSRSRREYTVIGDAVNLSARLMTAASWGEIIVSDATLGAAGPAFQARRMRPLRVKGKAAPVRAVRLLGAVEHHEMEAQGRDGLIGRDTELRRLMEYARARRRKRPAWAHVSGEPGIGKSRLVAEATLLYRQSGWRTLIGQSYAHTSHVPFSAWKAALRDLFGLSIGDDVSVLARRLEDMVPGTGDNAGLLGPILSLYSANALPESPPADATASRKRIRDAIVAALSSVQTSSQGLLLVFEDSHWMDASSRDLLAGVVQRLAGPAVVITSSRNTTPVELSRPPDLSLALEALPQEFARQLARRAGDLADAELAAVVERSNGNPLLVTSFARSSGGGSLPETVEDAITSRVDVLPPDLKSLARAASVAGPTFDIELIASLMPENAAPADRLLADLSETGITQRLDGTSFSFSHAVVRDVVYGMLPYAQRRRLHGRVVSHIESSRQDQLDAVCEDLLYHAELAEDMPRSVRYACMSGDRALRLFDGDAAAMYYTRGLSSLGDGAKSHGDRSVLLERVGDALELVGKHGDAAERYEESLAEWRSPGTQRTRYVPWAGGAASRAVELCRKTGVAMERHADFEESLRWLDKALQALPEGKLQLRAQVCAARSVVLYRVGRYDEGVEWGRRALGFARRSRNRQQIAYSHNMLAHSYVERGDLQKAVRHLRQAVRLYHDMGDFPGQASANNNLGICYHLQGTLDAALYHYQVALQTDRRVGDEVDATIVRNNIGEVLFLLGRVSEAMEHLNEVVEAHGREGGLTGVAGLAHINLSRCYLSQDDMHSAAQHIRRGKRLVTRAGQAGLVAEAELQRSSVLLAAGRPDLAVRAARSGIAQSRAVGARLLEARGQRVLGEALLAQGRQADAKQEIQGSVSLARRINANHEEALSIIALAGIPGTHARARLISDLRQAEKMLIRMGAAPDAMRARKLIERLT